MKRKGVVVVISALCGCPPVLDDVPGGVVSDGTAVVLNGGATLAFSVFKDGVLVGQSSIDPACPALAVGLRPSGTGDSWIDPVAADASANVDLLVPVSAVAVTDSATVELADSRGTVQAIASVTAAVGAEGFVDLEVAITTDDGRAFVDQDIGFVAACFSVPDGVHVVGGGERFDGPDLQGKLTPIVFSAPGNTESGTNEAHAPVPFFATSSGLGVLVETERVGAFDAASVPGSLQARFHGTGLSLRLRGGVARGDDVVGFERVTDNVAAHARRMGLPKPPPKWALAPMQWRNDLTVETDGDTVVSSGTDMLNGDVAALTSRGLPFSTVWIDAPWQTGYNTFVVNDVQLPDFDAAVASLAAHGIVPLVWATEHVNTSDDSGQMVGMPAFGSQALYDDFRARGFLVTTESGAPFSFPWGRGDGAYVDFTNPAACAAWQENIIPLLRRGVRGFKLDYGETMRADVLGLVPNTLPVFSDGSTTAVQHTRYARLYHECYIGALEAVHGDDWFIITRTGGIFDQKNGVAIWPGDLDTDFTALGDIGEEGPEGRRRVGGIKSGIAGALSCAMSGYPLYGHDVGGYRGGQVAPEAFARWAEAGAVQSIMQVGGGSNHAGWDDFLLDVADAFIASLKLKMSLWPMFEAALAAASRGGDGTPAMVPLGVVMGQDAEAWADPYATALFDARLVAYPVVEDGARTRGARLPAGDWIELRTGARTTGPATVTVDAPLGALPLFVRAGAALVLDEDSDALLPTSAAGRLGPQARRVLVVSAGPASETIADGLDVRQAPASDGGVNVRVTRARAGPLTIRAYGAFTAVDAGGAIVSELRPGAGFVEVDVESDGAVDVTLR